MTLPTDTKRAVDLVTELRWKTLHKLALLIELQRSLVHKMLEEQGDDNGVSMHDLEKAFERHGCSDKEFQEARKKAGL